MRVNEAYINSDVSQGFLIVSVDSGGKLRLWAPFWVLPLLCLEIIEHPISLAGMVASAPSWFPVIFSLAGDSLLGCWVVIGLVSRVFRIFLVVDGPLWILSGFLFCFRNIWVVRININGISLCFWILYPLLKGLSWSYNLRPLRLLVPPLIG